MKKKESRDWKSNRSLQRRSELDPVDAYRTQAKIEGMFFQRLFSSTLRTRNIFYLIIMLLFGLSLTGFMLFAIFALVSTPPVRTLKFSDYFGLSIPYIIFGFVLLVGVLLLVNFVINIAIILGIIKTKPKQKNKQYQKKKRKKKLPKHRKDYK